MKKFLFLLLTTFASIATPLLATGQGPGRGMGKGALGKYMGWCPFFGRRGGSMWLVILLLVAIVVLLALLVFKKKD